MHTCIACTRNVSACWQAQTGSQEVYITRASWLPTNALFLLNTRTTYMYVVLSLRGSTNKLNNVLH